jgi:competence protein ComEC
VPALVDGDDSAIPDDLEERSVPAGLTHLLAVSGTN